MAEELEKQLSILKQVYEEKKKHFKDEMKKERRSCLTPEQIKELNKDLAEINKLECKIKREKANQEFKNKSTCILSNPKTPSSELQNVTDTSQTN